MRTGKDSLAVPLMAKWENRKTLARAYGTSRRASGWAGENVARRGGLIRAIRGQGKQASLEEPYLVTRCGLAWLKARPGAKSLSWQTQGGRVKILAFLSILRLFWQQDNQYDSNGVLCID